MEVPALLSAIAKRLWQICSSASDCLWSKIQVAKAPRIVPATKTERLIENGDQKNAAG